MARLFLIVLFLLSLFPKVIGQMSIIQADSLFSKEQYTQALERYQGYLNNGVASSSMLLKMAFVEDATGNFEMALYYLNLYYYASADRTVVTKIEEIVKEEGLQGYKYDDSVFLISLFNKYKQLLTLFLIAISLLVVVYSYRKRMSGEKPYTGLVIQSLLMILVFCMVNLTFSKEAIVITDETMLRAGPSAGAEPVQIIGKGHKVNVLDIAEVWTKIRWEGEEVYVRNNRILII